MRAVHRRRPSLIGMLATLVMVFLVQALLASPVGTPTASAAGRCQLVQAKTQRPAATGEKSLATVPGASSTTSTTAGTSPASSVDVSTSSSGTVQPDKSTDSVVTTAPESHPTDSSKRRSC